RELATGIPHKQTPRDAVAEGTQIEEEEQHTAANEDAMLTKEQPLVGRQETQLPGQPADDHEREERSGERGVGDHRRGSSKAWSTRKYVICRPSGLTRTNSLGTRERMTKST